MDADRAAVTRRRPSTRRGARGGWPAVPPALFLAVFFAWPVAAIIGRGLSVRRRPATSSPTPACARSPGSRCGRPRSAPPSRVAIGLLAGLRARPLPVPRARPVLALVTVPVRAADGRGRRRVPRPAARPRCDQTGVRPSSSPTSSSTSPSSCARSATLWGQLDPRLEEAARTLGASPLPGHARGHAAAAAPGDRWPRRPSCSCSRSPRSASSASSAGPATRRSRSRSSA